jgi:hypothetical protein
VGLVEDARMGIVADIDATPEEAVMACQRAVDVLGSHATISVASGVFTVAIRPEYGRLSAVSPVVGIKLPPAVSGGVTVVAQISDYLTSQAKTFGFIPAGPKRLVGKDQYFRFLGALEVELRALDSSARIERAVHA